MDSLSTELLVKVFEQLPPTSLHDFLLVSKRWNKVAAHIRYRHLILSNNHVKVFKNIFNKHCSLGYAPFCLVRKLTFSYEIDLCQKLQRSQFYKLMAHLPRLDTIEFEIVSSYSLYLQFLVNMPKGSLDHIKHILLPNAYIPSPPSVYNYITITHKLHRTTTSLSLECALKRYSKSSDIILYLSAFDNLKELTIWNRTRYGVPGINMVSILSVCPQLIRLQLGSEFNDADTVTPPPRTKNIVFTSPVKNISVKELTLNVHDLTTQNIQYMLRNLNPTTLYLDLQITGSSLMQWIAKVDAAVLEKFITFVKNTKQFKLVISNRSNAPAQPHEVLTSAWKFIHSLYNPQFTYHLTFYLAPKKSKITHLIDYDSQKRCLTVSLYVPTNHMEWKLVMPAMYDSSGQVMKKDTPVALNTLHADSIKITHTEKEAKRAFDSIKNMIIMYPIPCVYYSRGQTSLFIGPLEYGNRYKSFVNTVKPRNVQNNRPEYLAFTDFTIESGLLDHLALVYSQIQKIVFKSCRFEKNYRRGSRRYIVDLQKFTRLDCVEIDTDCFKHKADMICVELVVNGQTTYYRCSLDCDDEMITVQPGEFLGKRRLKNAVVITIHCNQLGSILLKRKLVYTTTYVIKPMEDRVSLSIESLQIR